MRTARAAGQNPGLQAVWQPSLALEAEPGGRAWVA